MKRQKTLAEFLAYPQLDHEEMTELRVEKLDLSMHNYGQRYEIRITGTFPTYNERTLHQRAVDDEELRARKWKPWTWFSPLSSR